MTHRWKAAMPREVPAGKAAIVVAMKTKHDRAEIYNHTTDEKLGYLLLQVAQAKSDLIEKLEETLLRHMEEHARKEAPCQSTT